MRVKKEHFITIVIIILFGLLFFLPNSIDLITSEEIKYKVTVIISILVFLLLIYLTYDDISKRKFTTTAYIVLLDIISIINYIILSYTFLIYPNKTNYEVILHKNNILTVGLLVILFTSVLLNYLKNDKFIKK